MEWPEDDFVRLLSALVGEAESVQNFPPQHVPRESNVVRHLLAELAPHSTERGGPLEVREVAFAEGRSNLVVRYPSQRADAQSVSLVGMHLDVVPADASTWTRAPFRLTREGDELFGRGTTDCLGHVALVTLFLRRLAEARPPLRHHVVAVFIASEENDSIKGVGIDGLMKAGVLDDLRRGSALWVDASDSQPCMGTAGAVPWRLTAHGKRAHSGFPHNTVNSVELASAAVRRVQRAFYAKFPPHPLEAVYKFATPSTLKPTQCASAAGSINQIPPTCSVSGDIRLTPFYDVDDAVREVEQAVAELNRDLGALEDRAELGPVSRFAGVPGVAARVELEWLSSDPHVMEGIACDLDSPSYHAFTAAVERVCGAGSCRPFSVNGSLPLVRQMQRAGFDIVVTGFGLSTRYHADDESCLLSGMRNGFNIVREWVAALA